MRRVLPVNPEGASALFYSEHNNNPSVLMVNTYAPDGRKEHINWTDRDGHQGYRGGCWNRCIRDAQRTLSNVIPKPHEDGGCLLVSYVPGKGRRSEPKEVPESR